MAGTEQEAGLQEQGEDVCGDLDAEGWACFEATRDVGEVLLAFAGPARGIRNRPDLPLENVFELGYRQAKPKEVARLGAVHEWGISGVGLDLHPQL